MTLRCVSCLTLNPDANRFCGNCGAAFGYTVQQAAESDALISRTQWGALKHATILFADLVNSTEYVGSLDAEQAMEHLRPAVQRMCNAVEQFGGTVVRTLGDGVLALFGVPRAMEGHASLACEAALAIQGSFVSNQRGLRIRVGLHSGSVALDPEGVDSVKGGGVHGHAIHLASRVVGMAEPGGICLTSDCLGLARSAQTRPMGKHQLKGIAQLVELHTLLGMRDDVQSHHFHETALSPFRGREKEMQALHEALRDAQRGRGSVLGLSGAPGTGKSRLCHEFAQTCTAQDVPVSEVRTQLYGHATPLQPVLMLLRTCFFHINPAADATSARACIARVLDKLDAVSVDDLSLLHEFLGVAEVGSAPCSLNAKARRARLLGLLGEMVKQEGKHVCVVIFEDMHWLDEASGEFVSAMVQAVAGTKLLLLLNYRPAYQAPWSDLPHFHAIPLADLSAADTEALVRERLEGHAELQAYFPLIVERCAGNPFFAEELVHSLQEKSASLIASGHPPSALALSLPATVQAVIGERIDRLVVTQKKLLHICAVIGKEIPLVVLQDVAVFLVSHLEIGLEGLCEAELLQLLLEIAGGRRFAFRHPLIQEVAYNTQLKARRANLHAAVAVAMEAHCSAQPGEFSALIAYHYEASNQPVPAAQHEARAAKWAGSTNSSQAIRHWRKVWTLLDGQERSVENDSLRALAGGRIMYLGWREGLDPHEIQRVSNEAIALARGADKRLEQLLIFAQGRILQSRGGPADDYVTVVKQALAMTPPGQDLGRVALLHVALSQAYGWAGLLEQGLQASDAALEGIDHIDQFDRDFIDFSIKQWLMGIRSRLYTRMGKWSEAKEALCQMAQADGGVNDPLIKQIAHYYWVELAVCLNDIELAQQHSFLAESIAQSYSAPYCQALAHWCNGVAETVAGNYDTALQNYLTSLKIIENTGTAIDFETEVHVGIAECHLRALTFDLALATAKTSLPISQRRNNRLTEIRGHIVCAGALSLQPSATSWKEAHDHLTQAERLITVTGASIYTPGLLIHKTNLAQMAAQSDGNSSPSPTTS